MQRSAYLIANLIQMKKLIKMLTFSSLLFFLACDDDTESLTVTETVTVTDTVTVTEGVEVLISGNIMRMLYGLLIPYTY